MNQPTPRGFIETTPTAADPRMRGRTYAIPFETVWQAALALAGGGLSRWTRHGADDRDGVITASSTSWSGAIHDITIRISLDADGQTRVDASARPHKPITNFGRAGRRLRQFFRALDRALASARDGTTTRAKTTST